MTKRKVVPVEMSLKDHVSTKFEAVLKMKNTRGFFEASKACDDDIYRVVHFRYGQFTVQWTLDKVEFYSTKKFEAFLADAQKSYISY